MRYFIANWKANKDSEEAHQWLTVFLAHFAKKHLANTTVIIAPPFPLLTVVKEKIESVPNILLASQDISSYGMGSYTGEVSAGTLRGIVNYAIIGHSERRQYFHEETQILNNKIEQAVGAGITPILCVRNEHDFIHPDASLIAYEPIDAIGTGNNEVPEKVLAMKKKLSLTSACAFLYGGSITKDNARTYLKFPEIDGFLIGKSSLDPVEFNEIINQG